MNNPRQDFNKKKQKYEFFCPLNKLKKELIKNKQFGRIAKKSMIFMSSSLLFLLKEFQQLCADKAIENKRKTIKNRDIYEVLMENENFKNLFGLKLYSIEGTGFISNNNKRKESFLMDKIKENSSKMM